MSVLALLPNATIRWSDVAAQWRSMRDRGMLAPTDQPILAEAERRAAGEPAK
jgi:hypothetical protein